MSLRQKKTVYFVRHGKSVHNTTPVFQGAGSELSEEGIAQSQALSERLTNVPFEALISSPFTRARQTAQVIASKTGNEIIISDLFVELRKPSGLDGKTYHDKTSTELLRKYVQAMYTPGGRVDDAENFDDIVTRADKALAFLLARSEASLVVVTHGWFLRVIIARVLLGDQLTHALLRRFAELITIDNTSITVLGYRHIPEKDSTWQLITMNDYAHFTE